MTNFKKIKEAGKYLNILIKFAQPMLIRGYGLKLPLKDPAKHPSVFRLYTRKFAPENLNNDEWRIAHKHGSSGALLSQREEVKAVTKFNLYQ